MHRAATSLLATTLALLIALTFALLLLLSFARTWRYPALWPQAWQSSQWGGVQRRLEHPGGDQPALYRTCRQCRRVGDYGRLSLTVFDYLGAGDLRQAAAALLLIAPPAVALVINPRLLLPAPLWRSSQ